ncbi:hypothetical protein ACIQXI_04760 [Lysinibacillus sp. NPDC097195]|uniref:hypothetical protein n=1 Tax=Lysinibacillus sp. NPDC097195 TaxID=3364141 RepID=UPI003808ADF2
MKKLIIAGLLFVFFVVGTIFYQQHLLITNYRAQLYNQLSIIQMPINRILLFQQNAEKYTEDERNQLFTLLHEAYAYVANYTGGGLQLETDIREQYFINYLNTKNEYSVLLDAYVDATTAEQRELAHIKLKEQHEIYKKFLEETKLELVKDFE